MLLTVSYVNFPCVVALTLYTTIEFLHMLLNPHPSVFLVLQLQGRGLKSAEVVPVVSFLERSPWKISLRLVNL